MKNKLYYSYLNPDLIAKKTKDHGFGIYARKNVRKGVLLAIFGGFIMRLKEEEALPEKYNDTGMQIEKDFVLTSKYNKEDSDCFNHSCNPNAGFRGQIFLVSIKNIKKDSEVTIDYAMVTFKSKNARNYKLRCLCGARNCRGIVTNNDWKLSSLQKKYDGYFQYYLQEIINKNKKYGF